MNRRPLIPILLLPLSLQSCRDNSSPKLSGEELLTAMNGAVFEVKLPSDIKPTDNAGLAIRYPDGKIDFISDSDDWSPGTVVKVVCFAPNQGKFRWCLLHGNQSLGGEFPKFPVNTANGIKPPRTGLSVGDRLIRYSTDGSVDMSSPLPKDDDFDLIFHVAPE